MNVLENVFIYLCAAVIAVPIANLSAFRRGSRYLPDRRDLNRYFPGNVGGSAAARIANSFFTNVVMHCDALVDLHTGSFERANLPQIRAALDARHTEQTVLIARTDALGVNGFEDALERAERYLEAGADALFIESPASMEQLTQIGRRFGKRTALIHNMVEGGNTPTESTEELQALGVKVALYPAALLHLITPLAQGLLAHIRDTGDTLARRGEMLELSDMNNILGASELLATGDQYGE